MTAQLIVEVPLPPKALAANGGLRDGIGRSKATKDYRRDVGILVNAMRMAVRWHTPERARVHLVFGVKRGRVPDGLYRPRDQGNAIQSFKAGLDGVKDAGAIVDDDQTHLPELTAEVDRTWGPGVRITVEAAG